MTASSGEGPEGLLTTVAGVARVQEHLRAAGLDGWLLYDFKDRNAIAHTLLGLGWTTRRGYVLIPAEGEPRMLCHGVEAAAWKHLPWPRQMYSSWEQMESGIRDLVGESRLLATETSPRSNVPYLDLLPAGIFQLLAETGVELVSSGDLVSTFYARWSKKQYDDHLVAGAIVKGLAREAFERAASAIREGTPLTEGALTRWINTELVARGAPIHADCIVAIGPSAADPHYHPGEGGETIDRGDLLLIDLWGGLSEDSAPADQTWMGFMGGSLPERLQAMWDAIRGARDAAISFLESRHAAGHVIKGYEVDDAARSVIVEAGFGDYVLHRTGHSIDTELHGRGPNLDNLEARDDRTLVPGVGFSIEPGIYVPGEAGLRTEVNVFMSEDGPEVTVDGPQESVFLLLDDDG